MSLISVSTLALGIGADSQHFSLAFGLLLQPAPLQDEESVGLIWRSADRLERSPFFHPVVLLTRPAVARVLLSRIKIRFC